MKSLETANKETSANDKSNTSETPFFARFLEGQLDGTKSGATNNGANDGAVIQTLKYPSDRDEEPFM